jgi:hypothetical protein
MQWSERFHCRSSALQYCNQHFRICGLKQYKIELVVIKNNHIMPKLNARNLNNVDDGGNSTGSSSFSTGKIMQSEANSCTSAIASYLVILSAFKLQKND